MKAPRRTPRPHSYRDVLPVCFMVGAKPERSTAIAADASTAQAGAAAASAAAAPLLKACRLWISGARAAALVSATAHAYTRRIRAIEVAVRLRLVAQADSAAQLHRAKRARSNQSHFDTAALDLQLSHCVHNDEALQAISAHFGEVPLEHSTAERH